MYTTEEKLKESYNESLPMYFTINNLNTAVPNSLHLEC